MLGRKIILNLHRILLTKLPDKSDYVCDVWDNDFIVPISREFIYGRLEEESDFKLKKEWFMEYVDVKFEGYTLKAIKEYDHFLKQVYHDYMTLPPIDKQKPHKLYDAYILDEC